MSQQTDIKTTGKIVWAALTGSVLMYGFVLAQLGKATLWQVPTSYENPLELLSLAAPLILVASLILNKTLRSKASEPGQYFTAMVVSLALHESIALLGFIATFLGEPGNIFFYSVNALVAVIGNCLVFPSEAPLKSK
jgi:F0F1-type ATP synthase membrane subunit c/vacuolar-type H+-ATPase subunit K